jgi:hypothetical protein
LRASDCESVCAGAPRCRRCFACPPCECRVPSTRRILARTATLHDPGTAPARPFRRLGCAAFQPEIFVATAIPGWLRGLRRIQQAAADLGLVPSQFVAHFMLEWFASPERLGPDQGLDDLKQVIEVARAFPDCRVLTIPAGQFPWGGAPPQRRVKRGGERCSSA